MTVTVCSSQGVSSTQYLVSLVVMVLSGSELFPLADTLYMRFVTSSDTNTGSPHWMHGGEVDWSTVTKGTDPIPRKVQFENRKLYHDHLATVRTYMYMYWNWVTNIKITQPEKKEKQQVHSQVHIQKSNKNS